MHPGDAGPSGIVELDGRPKELTEFILRYRLEVCPYCGYVAEDIREKTSISRDYLQSPEYCSLQNPELSQSLALYLCAAHIQLAEINQEKAIEYYISAAWCADSLLCPELAVSCRKKALSLIFADNKTFADISSTKWVRVLDTMRRCGDFDSVIAHCTGLPAIADPALQQWLDYEHLCARKRDDAPHTNLDAANSNQCRPGSQNAGDEFLINGKSYSVEDDCHGNGWNWIAETRTLVLSNYHGTAIYATGDITIRLAQIDNCINSTHGPGIHVRNGNLKLSGSMMLSIYGDEGGIYVDSGTLEIAGVFLKIRTKEHGIFATGPITATDRSVIDIRSEKTAIKSRSGGLNAATGKPVLKIFGTHAGLDLAGDLNLVECFMEIESSKGCGVLSHHGSLSLTASKVSFICRGTCIHLENGGLSIKLTQITLNGASCAQVNGSCSIVRSNITLSGEDCGLFVSRDLEISASKCESSGKNAIAVEGNLQIQNVNVSASGEIGISVGGDMKCAGGILKLQGDTAMQISGNAEISDGLIMGVGKISGAVVNGSYFQSGGDISLSGETLDGMRISGKEMRIVEGGELTVAGRKSGLYAEGDVILEQIGLSASGNIGLSCKSLKIKNTRLEGAGEEIGLSVREGSFMSGETVTVNATGNVGIYTAKDIEIHGGCFQVAGQFGGIVLEKGDLVITDGAINVFGDEVGILLQAGSMKVLSGLIRISSSGVTNSGNCGIAVENGNLHAGGAITITEQSYAISVPRGDIILGRGVIEAYGYRAGITGKSLTMEDGILTAYGKIGGAVVLTERGPWDDKGLVVLAGPSSKTAIETLYSGQKYVHAYMVRPPDAA